IALSVVFLPYLLSWAIGISFPLKLALSAIVIGPLGFVMGMPFPKGLKIVAAGGNPRVEWAWAMNAGASVFGSVAAMVIAVHFGLAVTLMSAGFAYATAMLFKRKLNVA